MTSKTFVSGTTIDSAWLNDVNSATYNGGAVYTPGGTGAVPTTVQDKLRENSSPLDFGALGDGVADDTAAFVALFAAGFRECDLVGLTYNITAITVPTNTTIKNGQINGSLLIGDPNASYASFNDIPSFNVTIDGVKFIKSTLVAGTYAIRLINALNVGSIKNCYFENYDKAIYHPSYTINAWSQTTNRGRVSSNSYKNCNYFVYTTAPLTASFGIADFHFINNEGVALIDHFHLESFDGLVLSSNTCFFPGSAEHSSTKRRNIYINRTGWAIINGNNLFEAGEEAILIERGQNVNIVGNNIAWPGQRIQSSGIVFDKGDNNEPSTEYVLSVVNGNNIVFPTLHGIDIKCSNIGSVPTAQTGNINISGNQVRSAGNSTYYYGAASLVGPYYTVHCDSNAKNIWSSNNPSESNHAFLASTSSQNLNNEPVYSQYTLTPATTTVDLTGGVQTLLVTGSDSVTVTGTMLGNGCSAGAEVKLFNYSTGSVVIEHSGSLRTRYARSVTLIQYQSVVLRYWAGTWFEVTGSTPQPVLTTVEDAATTTPQSTLAVVYYSAPITSNRTVTLNSTNPQNGNIVRVSRDVASTGASKVIVGTKQLDPAQWCEHCYDGTTWRLTASGSI